ncbi:MAG TPA: DUF937 domain-containing protein [Thermotogota bacterium]|nr:DUF937 domain-containing protein [Thermotogota bacterium]HRW35328.1 DUF937 domain-containing protein [Thermotogota bacterium]
MDISSLFEMLMNKEALENLGGSVGANKDQVQKLINFGMPTIMKAMDRNAKTESGAESLYKALQQHQDDDVEEMAANIKKVDTADGSKILDHVFQDKQERIQMNLAKQTNMQQSQVSTILSQLAPLVLGALGQQQKQQDVNVSNLSGFLEGVTQQTGDSGMMKIVEQLLDRDKDGSVLDDVGRMFGNLFKRKK